MSNSEGPGVITPRVVDGRVLCHVQHDDVSVLIAADEDTTTHRLTEVATEAANAAVTYGKLFSAESRLGLDAQTVATDGGDVDRGDGPRADGGRDLGTTYYVVDDPHQKVARVVGGPFDIKEARTCAALTVGRTAVRNALYLVHDIKHNDYRVEWADDVERPDALVAADGGATGTLVLVDEAGRKLTWHHSVAFDGYRHTTACGREVHTDDIRDVEMQDPREAWRKNVTPNNGCPTCHDSVHEDREVRTDGGHAKYVEAAETTRTTVRFPTAELEAIEALVEDGKYLSTSEAVRHAVRDLIEHHADEESEATR